MSINRNRAQDELTRHFGPQRAPWVTQPQGAAKEEDFRLYESFMDIYGIAPSEYEKYNVKRGLRNADGTGVIAGLTRISNVHGYQKIDGVKVPDEGALTYRGFQINDLVDDAMEKDYFGFGRVVYLLLTGNWPEDDEAASFQQIIEANRELPAGFINGIIASQPPRDVMNALVRAIIALYPYDEHSEDIGSPEAAPHEIHAALSLIGKLPRIAILGHFAADSFYNNGSLIIHPAIPQQATAETILSLLRPDRQFTHEEAKMLDAMLMLHAEHGGGNNSTFTCRCLTSSGTDPYSAYAGAVSSLKGPKHGGANIRALEQQEDLIAHVPNWTDEGAVADYLRRTFAKETFDGSGLIYGMGHAVYTLSDPRALLCKKYAHKLAQGTEYQPRFELIETIERLSGEVMAQVKGGKAKTICANVDMYSGLVYTMLGIPKDLFTPLFACARMAGWAAHRFEEIYGAARIMRPAYQAVDQELRVLGRDAGQRALDASARAGEYCEDESAGQND